MAHIFDLAPAIKRPGYASGQLAAPGEATTFPDTEVFRAMNKPSRFEGDIFDLEVTGTIPHDIDGTFYRIQPDHRFPPLFEDDIHFNGDGSVTAIRIKDGHADFKQRYVQTDRYKAETAARRSLFGRYRNPWTDNETVKGVIRTASNTNITFWRGMLLASKEDGPPFAMDPVTLETLGRYDFEGQIKTPTFTAHPKFDPETGEMICFAYEAGGNGNDGSLDVVVWTINADGKKTQESWYKAPFAGMIHDMGVSKNYVVLPLTPLKVNTDRMKSGGEKFAWDPNEDQWYGLVPRSGGKSEDIIWFRADNGWSPPPFRPSRFVDDIDANLYQPFKAMLPVATRTRMAMLSSISPSPTAMFSSGGHQTHCPRGKCPSATSSAPRQHAGSSTPRPRPARASRLPSSGLPMASSAVSMTGGSPRNTSTFGWPRSTQRDRTTLPNAGRPLVGCLTVWAIMRGIWRSRSLRVKRTSFGPVRRRRSRNLHSFPKRMGERARATSSRS